MGLKKFFKKAVKTVVTPYALLGPIFHMGGIVKKKADEISDANKRNKEMNEKLEKEFNDRVEADFLEKLDNERRRNKSSNVVFAGSMGDGSRKSLGGRKSLLGL